MHLSKVLPADSDQAFEIKLQSERSTPDCRCCQVFIARERESRIVLAHEGNQGSQFAGKSELLSNYKDIESLSFWHTNAAQVFLLYKSRAPQPANNASPFATLFKGQHGRVAADI